MPDDGRMIDEFVGQAAPSCVESQSHPIARCWEHGVFRAFTHGRIGDGVKVKADVRRFDRDHKPACRTRRARRLFLRQGRKGVEVDVVAPENIDRGLSSDALLEARSAHAVDADHLLVRVDLRAVRAREHRARTANHRATLPAARNLVGDPCCFGQQRGVVRIEVQRLLNVEYALVSERLLAQQQAWSFAALPPARSFALRAPRLGGLRRVGRRDGRGLARRISATASTLLRRVSRATPAPLSAMRSFCVGAALCTLCPMSAGRQGMGCLCLLLLTIGFHSYSEMPCVELCSESAEVTMSARK
eukprot:6163443-Pleurochrysis_carterae.AAC.1